MKLQRRLEIVGLLLAIVLVIYGVARHYSSSLIAYVVEQALIQKAPSGTDPLLLHERFQTLLVALPDRNNRMEKLLQISKYLEKVQILDTGELEDLLREEADDSRQKKDGTFSISRMSTITGTIQIGSLAYAAAHRSK